MTVARSKPAQAQLSAVINTLGTVFRPDLVIPDTMLALLGAMDAPPAFVAAGALPAGEAMRR